MFEKNNELIILSGVLIIALFVMGMVIYQRSKEKSVPNLYDSITNQSQSTEIEDIEKDLQETNLEEIDKELQQIEEELENAYQPQL